MPVAGGGFEQCYNAQVVVCRPPTTSSNFSPSGVSARSRAVNETPRC
jgi:hypothetical protein